MPRSLLRLSWYLWVGAAYPGDFSGRARTRSIRSGTPDSNRCSRRDRGADAVPAMLAHPETDRCHHIIPLRRKKIDSSRSPLSLFSLLPDRRLEIRFGKFSLADFFDTNAYGSYTTFQFMNWTVDNNGAYDDAADTRGFTFATMLEYHERCWAVRFAEALMPKAANGIHLDADMRRARAENIEFELPGTMLRHQEGTIRFLSFINHANMDSNREAIDRFLETTRNISLSVVPVFFSATADSITAAGTLSKLITRCMFGGLRLDCSTSTILATSKTGDR